MMYPRLRQNPNEYWGRGGAGVLFTCSEDGTVMLMLRSPFVAQGLTWGIPGGAIDGDGWFTVPFPVDTEIEKDSSLFVEGAMKEVIEECGSLPPNFSRDKFVEYYDYYDRGFRYRNFVYDLTLAEKREWLPTIEERVSQDWESERVEWFAIDDLPKDLHFGATFVITSLLET